MKTMKNFAAQQLTKNQMNEVKGGAVYITCAIINIKTNEVVSFAIIEGTDLRDATIKLNSTVYEGEKAVDCDIF